MGAFLLMNNSWYGAITRESTLEASFFILLLISALGIAANDWESKLYTKLLYGEEFKEYWVVDVVEIGNKTVNKMKVGKLLSFKRVMDQRVHQRGAEDCELLL